MSPLELFGITIAAIGVLFFLVIKLKIHAFISLLVTSILVGLMSGMPFMDILKSVQDGMGSILGFIAIVIGLGAIFGEILQATGGAESLSKSMLEKFGEKRAAWAMMTTGFIIAIPVFLDVGFVILVPMAYALARKTGKSVLFFAMPLLGGLAVTHAFIPPTPGPIAVAEIIDVPLGWVIFFGFIVGFPTAIVAGPVFGKYIAGKIYISPPSIEQDDPTTDLRASPPFQEVLFLIGLPLVLILISTVLDMLTKEGVINASIWTDALQFIGHPFMALIIATLLAGYLLGIRFGYSREALLKMANRSLAPAGLIILVTGAGGVFKQILVDSGVGAALAEMVGDQNLAPVVLAYLLAIIIRLTQGSATVAMITAAGMVAPLLGAFEISDMGKALVVLSIASGATFLSHVNDSGFWLVGKYLNMTEKQTLQSWSLMVSIISVVGFILILVLSFFIP